MSMPFERPADADSIGSARPGSPIDATARAPLWTEWTRSIYADTGPTVPRGSLIVQKFGGSSVADAAGICRAARRIAKTREAGYQVVAVVSAMGDTTDQLCELAAGVAQKPNPGALDSLLSMGEAVSSSLLAMALVDCGQAARTFTGSQAGLITDSVHGKARITDVRPGRIRTCLDHDTVPIVAGFQGRTQKARRVTTLGRGGSDLTAVALAAALGAGICEIYTDVEGVYTADPRIVPTARKIAALSSEEMLEFAACGSKVMHLRSVEYARRFGLPIHVRSSFTDEMGTLILPGLDRSPFQRPAPERAVISEVSGCEALAEITVAGLPDDAASVSDLFRSLSQRGIGVQSIVEKRPGTARRADVVFSLPAAQAAGALSLLRARQADLGFEGLQHNGIAGKVMLSGLGMRSSPAVFSTFFTALSKARVDLDLIEISETGLGALTRADQLENAVRAVRSAFGLSADAAAAKTSGGTRLAVARGPRPGLASLQHPSRSAPAQLTRRT
ncbi:aspartate kinase [Arthrobacter sp. NPDC056493]|uniref:aspartate kinase n=1 Tax=Arthrobacter sp. NPDC056493 TaxID=3345839 RepID=UPI00367346F7